MGGILKASAWKSPILPSCYLSFGPLDICGVLFITYIDDEMASEKVDALERTVMELDVMASIFCNDFINSSCCIDDNEEFVVTTPDALDCARKLIECPPSDTFDIPRIDVELYIKCASDNANIGGTRLRICLPPGYPSINYAEVTVLSTPRKITRNNHDTLSDKLQCRSKELIGSEAMMEIVNECRDLMEDWYDGGNIDSCDQISEEEVQPCTSKDYTTTLTESAISRKWIWVHHITNTGRLKQIVSEAQTLKLGGFLKCGYPGIVVVEGSKQSTEEFVTWIKGNKSRPGGFGRNWGHHVRGEATVNTRQFPELFQELEDDMGKLGTLCKEFGVEDEFREFVLQHK